MFLPFILLLALGFCGVTMLESDGVMEGFGHPAREREDKRKLHGRYHDFMTDRAGSPTGSQPESQFEGARRG